MRALIFPREHGAWGVLLVPLLSAMAAGTTTSDHIWQSLAFMVAAIVIFWLRTPIESLLGTGLLRASNSRERQAALMMSLCLATASATCLLDLMWKLGRGLRMAAQMVGAIGLTSTAPGAYYVASGKMDQGAMILWVANWLFALNQIHFVQTRIHAARAVSFSERFAQGRSFFFAQPVLLTILVVACRQGLISFLLLVAFLPALLRGTQWFFRSSNYLDLKRLGWSEVKQGITFGVLVVLAFKLN